GISRVRAGAPPPAPPPPQRVDNLKNPNRRLGVFVLNLGALIRRPASRFFFKKEHINKKKNPHMTNNTKIKKKKN
ncbi:hypothetical protein ACVGXS_01590, partial [Enterobacter hormaechei]